MTSKSQKRNRYRRSLHELGDSALSARERKELERLAKMSDSAIDLSDIPEITDWSNAQIGRFYRRAPRSG